MPDSAWSQSGLHVIVKPIGAICNLDCRYCFYLEKEALYSGQDTGPHSWRMTDETLEAFVRQYMAAQPASVETISFAFQGGEPTLMGVEFCRRLLELQQKYLPPGKRVQNSLQTNGLLLDDTWCEFLSANQFLVGLSIDGPADLHDAFRRDKAGKPSFDRVMQGLDCLKKHGVEFNVLACVHRRNSKHPARVYNFFRDLGVKFLQFIPIVQPDRRQNTLVSEQSVLPEQFGRFLVGVFDAWIHRDVGNIFVRDFDQALGAWLGQPAALCVYAPQCGRALALEHNGDLYPCDHYVESDRRLGNIHEQPILELANSQQQQDFGQSKSASLPRACRDCRFLFACYGACPKDRFLHTADGEPGLNYLCQGFQTFFAHADPYLQAMAAELRAGRPAAGVMRRLRASSVGQSAGRNDPCPCGSGRKFKNCCLRK